jgi:ppGpp synthetase/RelA/SpoT-type nucleotidyltranferase
LRYSGKRIAKAGEALRVFSNLSETDFNETMKVISYWRQAHEEPVKKALDLISNVITPIDKTALFARRMKRIPSIFGKLIRYPKMSLYKINDIGGCRVIIKDRQTLYSVLRKLKKLPEFQISGGNNCKINDYIKQAKPDGYRSVHIIGKFLNEEGIERFVEIQLRTPIQHSWATAVEIVDLFTKQSLKTNQGDPEWSNLFNKLSEHFDIMDKVKSFVNFNPNAQYKFYVKQVQKEFGKEELLDRNSKAYSIVKDCYDSLMALNVVELFNGFANSLNIVDTEIMGEEQGYVLITCNLEESNTRVQTFPDESQAEQAYVEEEVTYSANNSVVVAMVSTPKFSELRLAYPNYFADSTVFLNCAVRITDLYRDMQTSYFASIKHPL